MKIIKLRFTASKSSGEVSALLDLPENPECIYVFAHGAGAGMQHPFMANVSGALAEHNIAVLRFNFPYTEKNMKRPDPAPVLMETIRSAVNVSREYLNGIPAFAGGKSMGGRMSSMMCASGNSPDISGLVFFGFPLHAPGKPSSERAEHLYKVKIPMLFLQGTRDKLADLTLLKPVIEKIGKPAELHIIENADHSFNILKSSGRSNSDVLFEITKLACIWMKKQSGL